MESAGPDIIVLAPEWPMRALLRAQLIEEGYDVVATDAWPIPRPHLRRGFKPRLVLIDLLGLPDPRSVLDELRAVIAPDAVLVVTALGSLTVDEVRQLGFHAIARPASIGDIVSRVHALLDRSSARQRT